MPHFMVSQVVRYAVKAKNNNEALMKVNVDGAGVVVDEHYTDVEPIDPDMVEIYMRDGAKRLSSGKSMTVGDLLIALHAFDIDMPVKVLSWDGGSVSNLCYPDAEEAILDLGPAGEEKTVVLVPDYESKATQL